MSTGKPPSNLGKVFIANQVATSVLSQRRIRTIILLLAASVALMFTGFGIIMPVFARRFGEFGAGVQDLGLMTMSFALAQFIASPFMGLLADRYGRRPLVLVALAAFALANVGFLFATSTGSFIFIRALEGAFIAGLFPAAMGVVADVVPENKRAQWVGIVMGSMGAGFVFGPVIGGVLYDGLGYEAPFIASAALATIAFIAAVILVPETRTDEMRRREALRQRRTASLAPSRAESIWRALPRPLNIFWMLLFLDFVVVLVFTYVEPQMLFYLYDDLGWSTVQFGVTVAAYGVAMMLGQMVLGRTSDKFGRKPVILLGLLLFSALPFGLAFVKFFPLVMLVAFAAGLGVALIQPALSAFYLDITAAQHRSRVMGIKGSAASAGGVAGPLLVAGASGWTTPQGIFISAIAVILAGMMLVLIILREPKRAHKVTGDVLCEISNQRAMAAQATLRGIVTRARTTRG